MNDLQEGTTIEVEYSKIGIGTDQKRPKLPGRLNVTVAKFLKDRPQNGRSYGISPEKTATVPAFFLKIPDATPATNQELLRRFESEANRADELNDLAETIRMGDEGDWVFRLPKFVAFGTIKRVDGDVSDSLCGLPFIMYDWINGQPLDEILTARKKGPANRIRADWFSFARGLTRVVARLHNHGFLHACIVPRNIFLKIGLDKTTCYLAGFGYASLVIGGSSGMAGGPEVDLPFRAPEFSSEQALDALWHQADIYSIGAVLLDLATGNSKCLEELIGIGRGPKNVNALKEKIRGALENAANRAKAGTKIVLENDNVAKIIDNCLRRDPDDRIGTAEELLEAINIADPLQKSHRRNSSKKWKWSELLFDFKSQREDETAEFVDRLEKRGHIDLFGSRTRIIEGLCRLIGGLETGAEYKTVTLPSYWTGNNLGPDGRFLAMNKYAAKKRGVKIQRIFLVSGPFHTLSQEEQQILAAQNKAKQTITNFEVRVGIVEDQKIQEFERSGQAVAFISLEGRKRGTRSSVPKVAVKKGKFLCLNFLSRGKRDVRYGKSVIVREIKKVRIWDPGRGTIYWDKLAGC